MCSVQPAEELFSVPLNLSLTPALSASRGNRMLRERVRCRKEARLLSDLCVKTCTGILPYLARLTDHSRGSARLHQIMAQESGGSTPLYVGPLFPRVLPCSELSVGLHVCVWWAGVTFLCLIGGLKL